MWMAIHPAKWNRDAKCMQASLCEAGDHKLWMFHCSLTNFSMKAQHIYYHMCSVQYSEVVSIWPYFVINLAIYMHMYSYAHSVAQLVREC